MGATARENWKRKRRKQGKLPPFGMLPKWLLDSPAYAALSLPARAALTELVRVYDGFNNGTLAMPTRTLAKRLRCSNATAARALQELDDVGFVDTTSIGSFTRKRRASEFRLTFHKCDKTGALPSKRFMHGFLQSHQRDYIVSPEKQRGPKSGLQSHQRDCKPPKASPHSLTHETHLESYHTVLAAEPARASAPPSSAVASSRPAMGNHLPSSSSKTRSDADRKCARCQPEPFLVSRAGKLAVTRRLEREDVVDVFRHHHHVGEIFACEISSEKISPELQRSVQRWDDAAPKLPLGPVIVTRSPSQSFKCSSCGRPHNRQGQWYCRDCRAAANRKHRAKQREKRLQYKREFRAKQGAARGE